MSKLREWRTQAGLSLQEVADLTGVSTPFLCRIELEKRKPSPMTRVRIARGLGTSIRDLFDVEDLPDEALGGGDGVAPRGQEQPS